MSRHLFFRSRILRFSQQPLERIQQLERENADLKSEIGRLQAPPAKKGGIRAMIAEKGVPFLCWYGIVWASGIGGFYVALDNDWLKYSSVVSFAKSVGLDKLYDVESVDPKHGKLAVAVISNELIEPLRIPFVLATLNPVLRLVRK
jgi:hypothetical protein